MSTSSASERGPRLCVEPDQSDESAPRRPYSKPSGERRSIDPLLARYLELNWRLVAFPRGQKGPRETGWTTKAYPLCDLLKAENLGVITGHEVEPGRFLCDVDLDWDDGVPMAKTLLPRTDAGFGRQSRPLSHLFYTTADPVVSQDYKDIDEDMLVELRGTDQDGGLGHQTMIPPSVHPSGERLKWGIDRGPIAHLAADELRNAVRNLATACILLKHVGRRGLLHDHRLTLAGFLLKLGVSENDAIAIGEAIAERTGNDVRDVGDAVRSTADKIERRERVKGGPALAKAIGDDGPRVIARIREWFDTRDDVGPLIEELNRSYAIIGVGNKQVVMETREDGGIDELWPFDEFKRKLIKRRLLITDARGNPKSVPLANVWLEHADGRQYGRLVYAMPGSVAQCGPEDYNGYLGFTVRPAPGDWSKNRDHILKIICNGDPNVFGWVFNWCAALVQQPGDHALTSIVLRGGQGVGKGHFAGKTLGALFFPQQYIHILGSSQLTGEFNEHLSGKVLIFADESTWGGDKRAAERLKGLVTEDTVPIHRKFLKLVPEPSALHIIIASNNEWPIAIGSDDRRFTVLDVSDARRNDQEYFGELLHELDCGGRAAMLHDLLAHHVDWNATRAPMETRAKRDLRELSLEDKERWWLEKLKSGRLLDRWTLDEARTGAEAGWPQQIVKAALHEDYIEFMNRHRRGDRGRRSTESELGKFLRKLGLNRTRPKVEGTQTYFYEIPPLERARAAWLKHASWPSGYEWDEPVESVEAQGELPIG